MSKIALSPNPSGTGTLTIAAPDTNTGRTLTLPDETGTILTSASSLASANLTGTVTVSGSNVGIGTSSPSTQGLHILSSAGVGAISQPYATLNIENSTGDPMMIMSGTSGGIIASMNNSQAATPLRFYTGQTERMRIDSGGGVRINNTANATFAAQLNTQFTNAQNCGLYLKVTNTSGGQSMIIFGNTTNNSVGDISTSGSSTAYNTSSDYRLKTDAQPMVGASDRVLALKPVNFEWISTGTRVDGFLAHEAQAVVPECVTGTKDAMRDEEYEITAAVLDADGMVVTEAVMGTRSVPDYQGIDQSKLVPLLTAALQEALTEISALKVRVAALEAV
jgi:hypothetical protein